MGDIEYTFGAFNPLTDKKALEQLRKANKEPKYCDLHSSCLNCLDYFNVDVGCILNKKEKEDK